MRNDFIFSSIISYFISAFSLMSQEPIAPIQTKSLTLHGHTRSDDYYWMNERDSKQVLEHLAKENAYTQKYFERLKPLQEKLLAEFESRIDPNEVGAPFILNGETYQIRNEEGKDYVKIFKLFKDKEQLFLDENERARGKSFYELADWAPSPDNSLLALGEDFLGRRKYVISFRNNNGKFLKDKILDTDGSIVWSNDNKSIFYIKKDPQTLREYQVFSHVLGTDPTKDRLIYQEDDEKFSVHISKSTSKKYIFIHSTSSTTSEIRMIDADNPSLNASIFWKREKAHIYDVEHHENGFYILSNKDAKNGKILFCQNKEQQQITEFISHDESRLIEGIQAFKNFLVAEVRINGLLKIEVIPFDSEKRIFIEFPEETYFTGLGTNDNYTASTLFYSYNSLTTPASVFQYDVASGKSTLWFRNQLKDKTFNPENYASKRIWAIANDGARIPVCLVYKKGIDLSNAPCLIYGYGSYGYTLPDVFRATRLSLLDRGFVYAVAHIRGSKYMGEQWYDNGKFLKKINTFTDFINAAEYLGMQGYCDPNRIYAQGGSAGGLLMGAVANMAPYLWKGVVAQVPFVDVVTTMLDESIPLTVGEYEEWGNPNEQDFYWYMLNYSPYDNVKKMNYPAMYITTGYHDSQVQYWEPMKWVAKLRVYRTNKNPLLFDCNMDAGHGGGSGRSQERLEIAKEFAFVLDLEGITE
jgi:oligopeptidase B